MIKMSDENEHEKIWFRVSKYNRVGEPIFFYTVYYCEDCKQQRVMYSAGFMKYKCDACDAIYKYSKRDNNMKLIRHGMI